MNQQATDVTPILDSRIPTDGRIAFIQSCWHKEIVDQCRLGFIAEMEKCDPIRKELDFFEVAGAFEIPLQAQFLARTGHYLAIVAAGLVVDGGIYRHEFVSSAVVSALMRVQLDSGIPIISAVLTPQQFHEHDVHQQFFREHFVLKGTEAARACSATIRNLIAISKK